MRTRLVQFVLLIAVFALNMATVCKALCPPSHLSHVSHKGKHGAQVEGQGITVCTVSDSKGYAESKETNGTDATIKCACADDLSSAVDLNATVGGNHRPVPSYEMTAALPALGLKQAWAAIVPVESPPEVFLSA